MQLDGYFCYILLCYLTLPTMGYHSLISVSKKQIDNSSISLKYFLPVNLETFRAIYITGLPYDIVHAALAAFCMYIIVSITARNLC